MSVALAIPIACALPATDAFAASKKAVTKVKLDKTKFTQTDISKPVLPTVTVYSGKKKLASKKYKVSFYEKQYRGTLSELVKGKWVSKRIYQYVKVKKVNVPLGQTSYATFKVVVKGKNGYKGSTSKTFKVKSAWTIKKPKDWKVGKYCDRYTIMNGSPFRCLDEFEPVYDENGKLLRYETCCGKYTVKK